MGASQSKKKPVIKNQQIYDTAGISALKSSVDTLNKQNAKFLNVAGKPTGPYTQIRYKAISKNGVNVEYSISFIYNNGYSYILTPIKTDPKIPYSSTTVGGSKSLINLEFDEYAKVVEIKSIRMDINQKVISEEILYPKGTRFGKNCNTLNQDILYLRRA